MMSGYMSGKANSVCFHPHLANTTKKQFACEMENLTFLARDVLLSGYISLRMVISAKQRNSIRKVLKFKIAARRAATSSKIWMAGNDRLRRRIKRPLLVMLRFSERHNERRGHQGRPLILAAPAQKFRVSVQFRKPQV
jgi:hypothetical protein